MVFLTSVFQICQAKFPEKSKSDLVYLTASVVCTRTQNLVLNSRCIALKIKSTAELLGAFGLQEADTHLLSNGGAGGEMVAIKCS